MKRMPRPAGPDLDRVGLWLDDAGADGRPTTQTSAITSGSRTSGPTPTMLDVCKT